MNSSTGAGSVDSPMWLRRTTSRFSGGGGGGTEGASAALGVVDRCLFSPLVFWVSEGDGAREAPGWPVGFIK